MVPLSAVVRAGRMDAEFFLGGDAKLRQAARLEELAQKHVRNAQRLRGEAARERAEAEALGVVVYEK